MFGKTIQQKRKKALERTERFQKHQAEYSKRYLVDFFDNRLSGLVKRGMRSARNSYSQGGSPVGEVRLPDIVVSHMLNSEEVRALMAQRLTSLTAGTGFTATAKNQRYVLKYLQVTWVDAPK